MKRLIIAAIFWMAPLLAYVIPFPDAPIAIHTCGKRQQAVALQIT
jgi:hypothetical protein